MAALREYSNVYNTALLILAQRGYQLWYDRQTQEYCAERGGWDFRVALAVRIAWTDRHF